MMSELEKLQRRSKRAQAEWVKADGETSKHMELTRRHAELWTRWIKRRRLAAKRMEAAEARVGELVKKERRRVRGGRVPGGQYPAAELHADAEPPANGS